MITRRINDDIPEDREILRHVVRELDQNVGVYARVVAPGSVSVGDSLRFI
jgi:MOSC domain-containing protein YiiM